MNGRISPKNPGERGRSYYHHSQGKGGEGTGVMYTTKLSSPTSLGLLNNVIEEAYVLLTLTWPCRCVVIAHCHS